jgi:hypothetical protein
MISTAVSAALIEVTPDRTVVAMDESFTLTFESKEDVDGDPDFSVLERDFSIVSQHQESSVQIVNGRMTKKLTWVVNLMPNKTGKLFVPPVSFGNDNSQLVKIEVKDKTPEDQGSNAAEIFIEVTVDNFQPYVQSQVIYTLKLFRAIDTNNASITEPKSSGANVVITRLGEDTQYKKQVQGRNYQVVERRYALFPQSSGELVIEPLLFEADVPSGRRLGIQFFNQGSVRKRVRSDALKLAVKAIPANFQGEWVPSSNVSIEEQWPQDPPQFRVGEPVTRTIIIQGERITAAQLPEMDMPLPSVLKQYPDQPQLTDHQGVIGILGERIEKIAIIPTTAGQMILPKIEIKWWDIKQQRQRTSVIPQREIDILPALDNGAQSNTSAVITPDISAVPSKKDETLKLTVVRNWLSLQNYWIWIAAVFALLWIVTLILLLKRPKSNQPATSTASEPAFTRNDAERELKAACKQSDAASAREAVILWGELVWPKQPPMTVQEIIDRVPENFAEELNKLNQSLYSAGTHRWVGDNLWNMVKGYRVKSDSTATESDLPPLYKVS